MSPITRPLAAAAAALSLLAAVPVVQAQPSGGRIVTMTRGMKVYGDAETSLIQALSGKDAAALDKLVDPMFEQRGGAEPGTPLPRDEWLKAAQAETKDGDRVSQMAVHDQGELAIVSFLLTHAGGQGDAFVVDVWKRTAPDQVSLLIRYTGAAAMPEAHKAKTSHRKASAPVVDTKK